MDERQQPPRPEEKRESTSPQKGAQKDAPTEGGGVAQGDIRVPRHPERDQGEREEERR